MGEDVYQSFRSVPPEELNEWMKILLRKNVERINTATSESHAKGHFCRGSFVEAIFSLCKEHHLEREVSYLASDIFERFMQEHLSEMHQYVVKHTETGVIQREWNKVVSRISNQVALRLMSCCQIASKFISSYKHLSSKNIAFHLRRLGHKYNEEAVTKSEARVFKTIGYCIDVVTPVVYVDLLLALLGQRGELKNTISSNRDICLDILDIVLVDREEIYQSFASVLSSSKVNSQSERLAIYAIEKDYLFLAASVLAASAFIIDQSLSDVVVESLSQISGIDVSNIVDMSSIILKPFHLDGHA